MTTNRFLFTLKRTGNVTLRLMMVLFFIISALSLPQLNAQAAAPAQEGTPGQEVPGVESSTSPDAIVSPKASFSAEATADTYLRQSQPTRNYGATTLISASPNTTYRQNPLYLWGLTSIPTTATVSAATITFYVTEASAYDFSLFQMRRAWVEGTSDDVDSTTSANWNTYNGTTSWGTAGAMNTTSDRYNTDLWDATASTFGTTGTVTIPLNASGVAAVQAWVTTPSSNYGATFQYTGTGTTSDYWIVAARNNTSYTGATLNVTYTDSTTPTITTTGTLSAFTTTPGVPSAAQTYTVAGSNLTTPIVITPPSGFELSTNGTTYNASLSLTPTSGTVATTIIYVRLTGAAGTFSGNITHTSTGATTVNVAASGTSNNCTTVSLEAAEDTYMSANDVTYNNGGNTVIHVDNTTGTARRGVLIRWDLSSIPTTATVSSADVSVFVTETSTLVFNLYNMRRSWVEGTSSQAASSTSANWNTYDGANSWGTVGAANTSSDRYTTNLWGAGASTFTTDETLTTIPLNSDGVTVVQGWINGSLSNYGLTIQNYVSATSNSMYFTSSEGTTAANRPHLNLTYCVSTTDPTISVTGTLAAFSTTPGVPSASQTYTVVGTNLTENIVITPPTGFELSTNGSTYSSSLSLTPISGTVTSTTIYVRLTGAEGTFSGNITHTSAGATTINLAASGTASNCTTVNLVAAEDTYLSANDVTFNNGGNTELHVDNTTGTSRRTTLLRWDLSGIPTNATVSCGQLSAVCQ